MPDRVGVADFRHEFRSHPRVIRICLDPFPKYPTNAIGECLIGPCPWKGRGARCLWRCMFHPAGMGHAGGLVLVWTHVVSFSHSPKQIHSTIGGNNLRGCFIGVCDFLSPWLGGWVAGQLAGC